MLTNKKRCREWIHVLVLTAVVAWLAGCTPAGPRALLRGKRLMEEGKYADAVEQLKTATSLLSTNALAWNYLGLAYHHAGQHANAVEAYERALKLNRDLVVVHYNLGCLYLEENRPETLEAARNELTAYVLHQGNSAEGWLKLGTAQLHLSELSQAEASFKEVLRLNPQNAEALNDLGVAQLERKRHRDAAAYFNAALKLQPNYPPALLNLAVTEMYLNNPTAALQKYQEYLALNPRPANWEAVNATAQQLEQQLYPPQRPVTNTAIASNPVTNNPNHAVATPTNGSRPETIASASRPVQPVQPRQSTPPPPIEPTVTPEVVRLPESQPIRYAGNGNTAAPVRSTNPSTTASTSQVATSDTDVMNDPDDTADTSKTGKHGFFQKLNPMGLFHRTKPKSSSTPTRPSPAPEAQPPDDNIGQGVVYTDPGAVSKTTPGSSKPISFTRYPYLSPVKPPAGNRKEAERWLAKGIEAQREHRLAEAIGFYRTATRTDPSYFEAQSSLGLAAYESGEMPEALRAYEMALAIAPDSFSARFNFGLALKRANYIYDAAQELERLLASNPNGASPAHLAMVHLTLANLYAEQFHQNAPARAHYLKVLELDPHNSQATSIRYWLQDNG